MLFDSTLKKLPVMCWFHVLRWIILICHRYDWSEESKNTPETMIHAMLRKMGSMLYLCIAIKLHQAVLMDMVWRNCGFQSWQVTSIAFCLVLQTYSLLCVGAVTYDKNSEDSVEKLDKRIWHEKWRNGAPTSALR